MPLWRAHSLLRPLTNLYGAQYNGFHKPQLWNPSKMQKERTSAGNRHAKPGPDAFREVCPSRKILSRLGERWAMLLLVRLKDRPRRFGELRREIEGITKKMLTQALRRLERDGLISRRTLSARPLAIEYLLTERGRDVVPIVARFKQWAESNWRTIHDSNRAFDANSKQ